MGNKQSGWGLFCAMLFIGVFSPATFPEKTAASAILYKNYVVKKDLGRDVLCDPYIVQRNDYVLKLFKARGDIAHSDFPEFLSIFKRINPQIYNINRILPGQQIFIPLKKLSLNSHPDQHTGIVTIPFVTISTLPELLKKNADLYVLRRGDTVSGLVSRSFGRYGTKAHKEGLRIFKRLNPHITNLNRVFAGQSIQVPRRSLRSQPWYASLFDKTGRIVEPHNLPPTPRPSISSKPSSPSLTPVVTQNEPLEKIAHLLKAKLLRRGHYYFPQTGKDDFKLDLAQTPVLELPNHRRVIVVPPSQSPDKLTDENLSAIKSFWPSLSILSVPPDAAVNHFLDAYYKTVPGYQTDTTVSFMDNGAEVSVNARWWQNKFKAASPTGQTACILSPEAPDISALLMKYLSKHDIIFKKVDGSTLVPPPGKNETMSFPTGEILPSSPLNMFVAAFLASLNISYAPDVAISFPYGGIQIPAVSNLITTNDGHSILVDFGNLYGDAVESIEKSGLRVIRLSPEETSAHHVEMLLTGTGLSFQPDPTISIIKASRAFGAEVSIPGFLVSNKQSTETLFSLVPLNPELIQLLTQKGLKIIHIADQISEN